MPVTVSPVPMEAGLSLYICVSVEAFSWPNFTTHSTAYRISALSLLLCAFSLSLCINFRVSIYFTLFSIVAVVFCVEERPILAVILPSWHSWPLKSIGVYFWLSFLYPSKSTGHHFWSLIHWTAIPESVGRSALTIFAPINTLCVNSIYTAPAPHIEFCSALPLEFHSHTIGPPVAKLHTDLHETVSKFAQPSGVSRIQCLQENYQALRCFQVLGIKAKNSDQKCQLAFEALKYSSAQIKDIYYALKINEILKCPFNYHT